MLKLPHALHGVASPTNGVVVTKRFFKDLKDDQKIQSTVADVLDCSNLNYHEMHKFEEIVGGALGFPR
ncbi:MAG: hypothetical protein NWF00_07145 [Candidatus Bathyarchaeota archaeon]|nr:hypothetical protein [Candidatus Bathyarchaeota archaeon]